MMPIVHRLNCVFALMLVLAILTGCNNTASTTQPLWTCKTSPNTTNTPVFHNGMIYVGSNDSNLYAINSNGALQWKFATGGSIMCAPVVARDGTIYVGSWDQNLYAVSPNGQLKWVFSAGENIVKSPAIGPDGTVFFCTLRGQTYALNPDGSTRWSKALGNSIDSPPAIGADGTVYIAYVDLEGHLCALNPDGKLKWDFSCYSMLVPAVGPDGVIYCGSDEGLLAINHDGQQKWSFSTGSPVFSPPIVTNSGIYLGDMNGSVYSVSLTGSAQWQYTDSMLVVESLAVDPNGLIFAGGRSLHAINSNGTQKWVYSPGDVGSFAPVIGNNLVYAGGHDGLYAFQP